METTWYLALIPGLPLLGALTVALCRNRWPKARLALTASIAVGLSFLATVAALLELSRLPVDSYRALVQPLWQWAVTGSQEIGVGLLADSLSVWFALVVTGVGLMIHIFSAAYMEEDRSFGRYFAALNYFIFAMSLLVLSDSFLGMLVGWANVGLASYLLIGFWHEKPEPQAAANKAFIMNIGGEVGLILGAALIFTQFGSFRFSEVFPQVTQASPAVLNAIALLLLVGAVAKSAQLPLHTWLPDAMQGPTPVSALIHAATMVTAGVYLVARAFPIYEASTVGMSAVALVGGASALYGAVVAVGQTDIKRVLAFSTMSQVGYMILGAGIGAYGAALFHFLTHAFFKALLFLAAGMVIHHLGGEQDIRRMGGLGKKMPFPYWTFLVGTLALAGAPPLAGFFSKDEILYELLLLGHNGYWVIGMIVAGLTAFYMFRLFCLVFAGPPAEDAAPVVGHGSSEGHGAAGGEHHGEDLRMSAPVAILAALSVVGGWIAIPGLTEVPATFLGSVFQHFPGVTPAVHHPVMAAAKAKTLTMAVVLVLSALGAAAAVALYGPSRRPARVAPLSEGQALLYEAFYVDRFYRRVFVPPVKGLAFLLADTVEPRGIDGIVNGVAGLVRAAAEGTSELHSGYLRRYGLTLAAGTLVVVVYFLLL